MKKSLFKILIMAMAVALSAVPAAQALVININPEPGLASNPDALAAFNRGADQWEAKFTDPITVNIKADYKPLGQGILGQASSALLLSSYDYLRGRMIADAVGSPEHAIVNKLPGNMAFWVPGPGFSLPYFSASKANWKALGEVDPDPLVPDATITFSSGFSWTFDRPGGVVSPGTYDFETVAAHEIGHALGFFSEVDWVDYLVHNQTVGELWPTPLDLFRFRAAEAPTNLDEFELAFRSLEPGVAAVTADTIFSFPMSTGVYTGDGRQASHWKDDGLSGNWIGLMDPTLASGVYFDVADADVRALDLMGYDLRVAAPVPGAVYLLASGLGILVFWRRRP